MGSCVDCPDNMFGNSVSGECANCVAPCQTCSGFAACKTCAGDSYLLVINQCLVLQTCPGSTFLQRGAARSCQMLCDVGIADPNSNTCVTQCPANYFPSAGVCRTNCGTDEYLAEDLTCKPCTNSLGVTVSACLKPLTFSLELKTNFNDLMLFVKFSRPMNFSLAFTRDNFRLNLYPYLVQ